MSENSCILWMLLLHYHFLVCKQLLNPQFWMFFSTIVITFVCLQRDPSQSWLIPLPERSTMIGLRVVVPPGRPHALPDTQYPEPVKPVPFRISLQDDPHCTKHSPVIRLYESFILKKRLSCYFHNGFYIWCLIRSLVSYI